MALLTVEHLSVSAGGTALLEGVSLSISEGEVLALVGESGSGKSLTAMSVVRLLPRPLVVDATTLSLDGIDLLTASEATMNTVRGGRVGVLFQQPKRMLDPTATVGAQVAEPLRRFRGMSRREA